MITQNHTTPHQIGLTPELRRSLRSLLDGLDSEALHSPAGEWIAALVERAPIGVGGSVSTPPPDPLEPDPVDPSGFSIAIAKDLGIELFDVDGRELGGESAPFTPAAAARARMQQRLHEQIARRGGSKKNRKRR